MKHHFSLDALQTSRQAAYLEFLKIPEMSAGLYVLETGATDPQEPHSEDEIYIVLSGQAQIRIGETDYPAKMGDTIFVPAFMPHKFHSILETIKVIVVFAPAEYSKK
jgi:mannose-6-phosphate isomerase-like protein (cupin superfamily)